jgi:hypothetical protein
MDSLRDATVELLPPRAEGSSQTLPVVAVIGWGVPGELVESHGATVLRVLPEHGRPTPLADTLVGSGEAHEIRSLLEPALEGSFRDCALLVVTRSHEWVYYFLKEAARTGAGESGPFPPLHLHDFIASSNASLSAYNAEQVVRLQKALRRVLGDPSQAVFDEAITASNARRDVMRRLADLRRAGRVSGVDAVRFAAAAATQSARAFVAGWSQWQLERSAPEGRARLLLLSGDDDSDGKVHQAIEAAGAIIVAEDGEWGIRTATPDLEITAEPLDALVDAMLDGATGPSVSPRELRLGWALEAMERDDIDAVVFAIPPSDSRYGWDYPVLRDRATSLGLPQYLLSIDARVQSSAATEAIAAFLSTLGREIAA